MSDIQDKLTEKDLQMVHYKERAVISERRYSQEILRIEEKNDSAENRIRELEVDLEAKEREVQSVSVNCHRMYIRICSCTLLFILLLCGVNV